MARARGAWGQPVSPKSIQGEGELRQRESDLLRSRGWAPQPDGWWRHHRLEFPWPVWMALRLQREADRGGRENVHLMLREEYWP